MDTTKDGLLLPGVDFRLVRDGRRSPVFYYDVDLSTARSVASGTHLVLTGIAGDSFYVDKNPTLIGAATVHFQDVSFGAAPSPIYCEPGFIANLPFTQLLVENTAQPGKVFRFFYGVGIDFQPGTTTNIVISGGVSVADDIATSGAHWLKESPGLAIGTVVTPVFLPAANVSGATIKGFSHNVMNATTGDAACAFIAALTAPVDLATKASAYSFGVVYGRNVEISSTTTTHHALESSISKTIPAGWGLWLVERVGAAIAINIISTVEYQFS